MSYYPHTNTLITHSFGERLTKVAEFNDSVLDMASWKNPRWDGCKMKAKEINRYTPSSSTWEGDDSIQTLSVINNLSTAIYLSNTVVGGTEDPQFATIIDHSYVKIDKILLIDLIDDSVQLLDAAAEPFHEFHRFITNDFPTGNKCKCKVIQDDDEYTANILQPEHRVKMNKGFLLKSFTFQYAGEYSGSTVHTDVLTDNNSMYLYKRGIFVDNYYETGSENEDTSNEFRNDQLRFRYGIIDIYPGSSGGTGGLFDMAKVGPSFRSSSIHENKFTQQFYSGSYGHLKGPNSGSHLHTSSYGEKLASSAFGSASKFIALDSTGFLASNNANSSLSEQEKTEIHITFFQGTKDFAPNTHDERSIGTFEVDQGQAQLAVEQGDNCNNGLPTNHEIVFKGPHDARFKPTIFSGSDSINNAHIQNMSGSSWEAGSVVISSSLQGCTPVGTAVGDGKYLQAGITIDRVNTAHYYVQGGALGQDGYHGAHSSSNNDYGTRLSYFDPPKATHENYYSGSFYYELSFLDKDHTLLVSINKDTELYDGVGPKGLAIIPEHSHPQVSMNIDFYLQKAGVISNTTNIIQNITPNLDPPGLSLG